MVAESESQLESAEDEGMDAAVMQPLAASAVRAGWQLVDAHERLGRDASQEIFGRETNAWIDYARETVPDLVHWPSAGPNMQIYENDPNRLRYRRVLDFSRDGDHIFDVGFGTGYLCGVLLRDGRVDSYRGIDLVEKNVDKVHDMLATNGFRDADVGLEIGDLYEMTPDQVSDRTTFMICCEVLEHVPDAEEALKVLARCLPPGADLLISVPLMGRLEQVWGHASVFDSSRLKGMFEGAGLTVHHVEPLANAWTLAVASHSEASSNRITTTPPPPFDVSAPLTEHRKFVDVPVEEIVLGPRRGPVESSIERSGRSRATLEIEPTRRGLLNRGRPAASLRFAVPSLTSFRVEITYVSGLDIRELAFAVLSGGAEVATWIWNPTERTRKSDAGRRLTFRPDLATNLVDAEMKTDSFDGVDAIEIRAEVAGEIASALSVRAAYLP